MTSDSEADDVGEMLKLLEVSAPDLGDDAEDNSAASPFAEQLYVAVEAIVVQAPLLCGKVTGMLLGLPEAELLVLVHDKRAAEERIYEVGAVPWQHCCKGAALQHAHHALLSWRAHAWHH